MAKKIEPRIIENHDYMSVVLGSKRLTVSYSGIRASGSVPREVWQLWNDLFGGDKSKPEALARIGLAAKTTNGEVVKAFVANIDKIWPDWAKEAEAPAVNDTVLVDFGQKDGIDTGVVLKIIRNKALVKFSRLGNYTVPFHVCRKPI